MISAVTSVIHSLGIGEGVPAGGAKELTPPYRRASPAQVSLSGPGLLPASQPGALLTHPLSSGFSCKPDSAALRSGHVSGSRLPRGLLGFVHPGPRAPSAEPPLSCSEDYFSRPQSCRGVSVPLRMERCKAFGETCTCPRIPHLHPFQLINFILPGQTEMPPLSQS